MREPSVGEMSPETAVEYRECGCFWIASGTGVAADMVKGII